MGRSSLAVLWFGGIGLALAACGDSGAATGAPPGAYVYGAGEDPYSNYDDPPTSDTEDPFSFTEGAGCGVDERISFSYVALHVSLPLCELSASCSDSVVNPQPGPGPGPGPDEPMPNSGERFTLDMIGGFGEIPSFCLELAMSQSVHGEDTDQCGAIEALGHVAQQYPACEQYMILPRGLCAASLERCVDDIIAGGCGPFLAEQLPPSCQGVESLESPQEPDYEQEP